MGIKFIAPKPLDKEQLKDFYGQMKGVHEIHPVLPDDTLCGIAISDNVFSCASASTNSKASCLDCLRIIKFCKSL